jgi:hypothetical protein
MTRPLSVVPEDFEQELVMRWADGQVDSWPELALLYAIANGGFRSKRTAATLKRTGVKRGVPDLCLPVARGGFHGLYVEMKRLKGGRLSPEQKHWLNELSAQGYETTCCEGHEAAIAVIKDYLAADGCPNHFEELAA